MESGTFTFSIPEHTIRLDGYMDAVGRVVTTDSELYALCARTVKDDVEIEGILGVQIQNRNRIENWSKEFSSLAVEFLGLDERSRLAFYLIDTICWFKEFTSDASCFKFECARLRSNVIEQAAYVLELEGSQRVSFSQYAQRRLMTNPCTRRAKPHAADGCR
jgi:hypothetical protein